MKPQSGARRKAFADPVLNRSLERGIEVLRSFRQGNDVLGNGEIAERTGLARATVSRLAQTLVGCGMLEYVAASRAYRLAAPVLAMAHVMRTGSPILSRVTPLLRKQAQALRVNAGLAAADRDDMIYLDSVRYHPRVSQRNIVAGQRVPIRLTSLGRAWLGGNPAQQREAMLQQLKRRHRASWKSLGPELADAISSVAARGFCVAAWQPGVVALGAPVVTPEGQVLAVNLSVSDTLDVEAVVRRLHAPLLRLKEEIELALQDNGQENA